MQAYIKYKAYYTQKANAPKLKEADYVYVLQPKADHQGSKIPFTEIRWIGPYIIEKLLPYDNCLARKNGTKRTQVLHRMRGRQFTPRQLPANIRITPQEYKPDPDGSLKHDDFYTRAWECDYGQPNFDATNINATPPNSAEFPVDSDVLTEEMKNTPGTAHECPQRIFLQRKNYVT